MSSLITWSLTSDSRLAVVRERCDYRGMVREMHVAADEDGGRGPRSRPASRSWKGKEVDSPVEPPEECSPAQALLLAQGDLCWTLNL